jgi:hypothetical protein
MWVVLNRFMMFELLLLVFMPFRVIVDYKCKDSVGHLDEYLYELTVEYLA